MKNNGPNEWFDVTGRLCGFGAFMFGLPLTILAVAEGRWWHIVLITTSAIALWIGFFLCARKRDAHRESGS